MQEYPLSGMLRGPGEAEILSWCFLFSWGLPHRVSFRAAQMCGPCSEIRLCILSMPLTALRGAGTNQGIIAFENDFEWGY